MLNPKGAKNNPRRPVSRSAGDWKVSIVYLDLFNLNPFLEEAFAETTGFAAALLARSAAQRALAAEPILARASGLILPFFGALDGFTGAMILIAGAGVAASFDPFAA